MAALFSPRVRVEIFHGVLRALIDSCEPVALVFKHSQQIVSTAAYRAAYKDDPIERPGSLNVRYFTVANSVGDQLMDTRGLDEIGLHDLQCHFRDLDPSRVSSVLYSTALYIFERGPVIESGQTVEGIVPGSKWSCQFEQSILEPKRNVLDLNPGARNAAGNRQSDQ